MLVLTCLLGLGAGGGLIVTGLTPPPPASAPLPRATFHLAPGSAALTDPQHVVAATATSVRPNRLVVDSLGIDAPLRPQDLDGDRLVIPGDPRTVGWWRGGASLSARNGTTLLAGHVDKLGEQGALHDLYRVEPGAQVVTTDSNSRRETWRVVSLEVLAKADLPTFPSSGPRRLAVVTCGGAVVSTDLGTGYADNVIVIAEPEIAR